MSQTRTVSVSADEQQDGDDSPDMLSAFPVSTIAVVATGMSEISASISMKMVDRVDLLAGDPLVSPMRPSP